jgi:hypothetical protein
VCSTSHHVPILSHLNLIPPCFLKIRLKHHRKSCCKTKHIYQCVLLLSSISTNDQQNWVQSLTTNFTLIGLYMWHTRIQINYALSRVIFTKLCHSADFCGLLLLRSNTVEKRGDISREAWLSPTDLHENREFSKALRKAVLHRNTNRSVTRCGEGWRSSFTPLRKVWQLLDQFSQKQHLLNNSHTKFK